MPAAELRVVGTEMEVEKQKQKNNQKFAKI